TTSRADASPSGTSEPFAAETGPRRDGDGRRGTTLSGMRPAPPLRHRPPGPDDGILRLRIPGVLEDPAWAGGFTTGCYDARSALTMFRRAARAAGRTPPTSPITTAKIKAFAITPGEVGVLRFHGPNPNTSDNGPARLRRLNPPLSCAPARA